MNAEEESRILNTAINRWGVNAQLGMMQEEAAELIVAINKYFRAGGYGKNWQTFKSW